MQTAAGLPANGRSVKASMIRIRMATTLRPPAAAGQGRLRTLACRPTHRAGHAVAVGVEPRAVAGVAPFARGAAPSANATPQFL